MLLPSYALLGVQQLHKYGVDGWPGVSGWVACCCCLLDMWPWLHQCIDYALAIQRWFFTPLPRSPLPGAACWAVRRPAWSPT